MLLHDLSFRIEPGQMVALVGPSGAGKTTIAGLVSRLYDATGGTVLLADTDVRTATIQSVRERVGVVSQDAHLFHDTLRANLRYARPDATDDELIDLMLKHPILINRSIVVTSKGVRLCRPSEVVLEILPNPDIGGFRKENGEVVVGHPAKGTG